MKAGHDVTDKGVPVKRASVTSDQANKWGVEAQNGEVAVVVGEE
jgi:hypothetical protein